MEVGSLRPADKVHLYPPQGTKTRSRTWGFWRAGLSGSITVLGRRYLAKQAAILLKMARSTSDAELSAKLVTKAAELTANAAQVPQIDLSVAAPDVEP